VITSVSAMNSFGRFEEMPPKAVSVVLMPSTT
jgi:hypothetical protein